MLPLLVLWLPKICRKLLEILVLLRRVYVRDPSGYNRGMVDSSGSRARNPFSLAIVMRYTLTPESYIYDRNGDHLRERVLPHAFYQLLSFVTLIGMMDLNPTP